MNAHEIRNLFAHSRNRSPGIVGALILD